MHSPQAKHPSVQTGAAGVEGQQSDKVCFLLGKNRIMFHPSPVLSDSLFQNCSAICKSVTSGRPSAMGILGRL